MDDATTRKNAAAKDEQALRELAEGLRRAEAEYDASFFERVLADDIVIMPPWTPAISGPEACLAFVRSVLEENAREFECQMTDIGLELRIAGDMAFDRGRFVQTLTPKAAGRVLVTEGQYLRVFTRAPKGPWKVARVIWNLLSSSEDEPPPTSR
jgi:ketosteroid isomerase-like protein